MNSKRFILLSWVVQCLVTMPVATAQMRGSHPFMARPSMQRSPVLAPMARMPMHRTSTLNSRSGFRRFNDGDFDRDDGFRRFHRFNEIVVFDNFGFPFFPFDPFYYPYPYPYPYAYYPYGAYGSYGYGANVSVVVQVQRRLASDGFYSGRIDGVVGRGTRRAIRAFERSHGLPVDGTIHRRLLTTMGLA
jgi:hypothetical protein